MGSKKKIGLIGTLSYRIRALRYNIQQKNLSLTLLLFLCYFIYNSTLRNEISCTTNVGCVILAGVMTWLEGSSIVRNLSEVG